MAGHPDMFLLKLPPPLRDRVEAAAIRSDTTLTNIIQTVLEQGLPHETATQAQRREAQRQSRSRPAPGGG